MKEAEHLEIFNGSAKDIIRSNENLETPGSQINPEHSSAQ